MDRLGEYLVRRLVGEGGMGKVYEAEERLTKRRVALKVLRQELSKSEEGRRLFLNEMQILAHLEHPNVVRSLASLEIDGELVIVLEYLEGRTLRAELVERERLPWSEAVEITSKIAEALAAAHAQEPAIVHRDLKPENVMILSDGDLAPPRGFPRVKVMDFGIAKVLQAARATNTQSIGTLQYMSPEQIDARPIDGRSDLYALGLILYELLSGKPPFEHASPRELLNLQCTAEPPELSAQVLAEMPGGVEDLLCELLQKNPADRPLSAREVVERLAPFRPSPRGARTTTARQPSTPSTPSTRHASSAQPTVSAVETTTPSRRSAERPPRLDTVALVEASTAAREVPKGIAIAIIVALSLAAGIAVYGVRRQLSSASSASSTSSEHSPKSNAVATVATSGP